MSQQAIDFDPKEHLAIGNKGYANFLLGNIEAARENFLEAFHLGGEALFSDTLDDLKIHPVPQDKVIEKMIREIWAQLQAKQ